MSTKKFDSWATQLAKGFVIEEELAPEEPVDVDEIEGLFDDIDGELEVSDDHANQQVDPGMTESDGSLPQGATGDAALDDFLKGIG